MTSSSLKMSPAVSGRDAETWTTTENGEPSLWSPSCAFVAAEYNVAFAWRHTRRSPAMLDAAASMPGSSARSGSRSPLSGIGGSESALWKKSELFQFG